MMFDEVKIHWQDDVYSSGKPTDGNYSLLSEAIKNGLFHPRCKDSTSTYYEGITTLKPVTSDEMAEMDKQEKLEQQKSYCENQAEKCGRISKYSLDSDNKQAYAKCTEVWQEKAEKFRGQFSSDDAESESSKPKYLNRNTVVDKQIIDSPSYRKTINKLGESQRVSRSIFQRIKEMLSHRSGGNFEDLSFIDSQTGKYITRADYNIDSKCIPSKKMIDMALNAEPNTIIAVHNHPSSTVPSLSDINTALKKRYKYGVIACHNGDIYKYTVLGKYNEIIVDSLLDTVNKLVYNRETIEDYDKLLTRTLTQLKENNVVLEVFLWE